MRYVLAFLMLVSYVAIAQSPPVMDDKTKLAIRDEQVKRNSIQVQLQRCVDMYPTMLSQVAQFNINVSQMVTKYDKEHSIDEKLWKFDSDTLTYKSANAKPEPQIKPAAKVKK